MPTQDNTGTILSEEKYPQFDQGPLLLTDTRWNHPDSKVHGANMGLTWGRQDPGGPHVGHMNIAICAHFEYDIVE